MTIQDLIYNTKYILRFKVEIIHHPYFKYILPILIVAFILKGIGVFQVARRTELRDYAVFAFIPIFQYGLITALGNKTTWLYWLNYKHSADALNDSFTYEYHCKWYMGYLPLHPIVLYAALGDKIFIILLPFMYLWRCFLYFRRFIPEKEILYTILSAFGLFPILVFIHRDALSRRIPGLERMAREKVEAEKDVEIYWDRIMEYLAKGGKRYGALIN